MHCLFCVVSECFLVLSVHVFVPNCLGFVSSHLAQVSYDLGQVVQHVGCSVCQCQSQATFGGVTQN